MSQSVKAGIGREPCMIQFKNWMSIVVSLLMIEVESGRLSVWNLLHLPPQCPPEVETPVIPSA